MEIFPTNFHQTSTPVPARATSLIALENFVPTIVNSLRLGYSTNSYSMESFVLSWRFGPLYAANPSISTRKASVSNGNQTTAVAARLSWKIVPYCVYRNCCFCCCCWVEQVQAKSLSRRSSSLHLSSSTIHTQMHITFSPALTLAGSFFLVFLLPHTKQPPGKPTFSV